MATNKHMLDVLGKLKEKTDYERRYSHFLKLNTDKRDRIVEASFDEFIKKGYSEASTNSIVQNASISKGLLFRYFENKEGLYNFLMIEAMKNIVEAMLPQLPQTEFAQGDVLEAIKKITRLKLEVCIRTPKQSDFLLSVFSQNSLPASVLECRSGLIGLSYNYLDIVIAMIDKKLLRDDVDSGVAAEIISWVCEKYTAKILASSVFMSIEDDWDSVAKELEIYMNTLKSGLYK